MQTHHLAMTNIAQNKTTKVISHLEILNLLEFVSITTLRTTCDFLEFPQLNMHSNIKQKPSLKKLMRYVSIE